MRISTDAGVCRNIALRLLSSAAIIPSVALVIGLQTARPAIAGSCTPGPTSVCSGAGSGADVTQNINLGSPVEITTTAGFGLDITDGGDGFSIVGLGGVTFTDNFASIITTNGSYGIFAENTVSGTLSIVSTGTLIATGGDGIRTYNDGADTLVRVHDTEGDGNGINVDHQGSGSVHIISTGQATGHTLNGIYGYVWSGTSMTVEAVDTQGAHEGIFARNGTSGALVVTSTGQATGTSGRGILADNIVGSTDVTVSAVNTHGGDMGIRVNHYGTGFLEVNSTGTASGGLSGLSTLGTASSTTATINAADTDGGGWGIYAIHEGAGPITVTSTGTAIGHGGAGIVVQTGTGSSGLNLTAHNARGGQHGIQTDHNSAAGTPGNTAAIVVTGHILGGTGYGITTASTAGVLTTIDVQAGALVESNSGNAIANDDGDSAIVIADGGTVNGRVSLGFGNDTITLRGSLSGITVLDGGGGGTDVLNLSDAAHVVHAGSAIQNWSAINLDNSRVTLTEGGVTVGTPGDMTTGIFLRNGSTLDGSQDNFSLNGNMSLAAGTQFIASGNGSGTNAISGNVVNAGLISAAGGGAGDRIRIAGDYAGNGGTIVLETRLGDDTSPTDKLEIAGGTSGTSTVRVTNANGPGAATNEGIEIIKIAGASHGVFALQGDYQFKGAPAIVGGAYAYRLEKGNASESETNNWYLRSELYDTTDPRYRPDASLYQPGASAYEAYPHALLGLNTLSTLQQRVGNRAWMNDSGLSHENQGGPAPSQSGSTARHAGVWARVEGARNRIDPHSATAGKRFDQTVFKAQAGVDGPVFQNSESTLQGGITAHYSQGVINTHSEHGDGRIATSGYGLGGTLTWYGYDGLYIDGQAQGTWYQSELSSLLASRTLAADNDAFGYTFSLESGHRASFGSGWSITPQAQLVYSNVDFDTFVDVFGAPVSLDRGASLQGRLGLTLAHETSWRDVNGQTSRAQTYGIANIYHEFLDGSRVDVADTRFHFKQDRVWGGLGAGSTYSWRDDAYSLYAEALVNTSLASVSESYSLQGKAGGRMRW